MRLMLNATVVVALAIMVSACGRSTYSPTSPTPTPDPTTVTLTGLVRNSSNGMIQDAAVKILDGVNAGLTTTTDGGGQYKFDGLAVGSGNVSASANGYQESRMGVEINGSNTLDFVLEPVPPVPPALVSLTGTVRSSTGSPLSGAAVRILDGVNTGRTATTVAAGAYQFDGLTIGNGNLAATAIGYQEARAGVYINGSNTLDFVLKPEVIDPNGTWVGSGTGVASDGSPVSITVELKVAGGKVVDWTLRYSFPNSPGHPNNFPYGCTDVTGSSREVPIINSSFEDRRFEIEVNNSLLYTPTIKGTFSSSTAVTGVVTLVKTTPDKKKECPASATVKWSGTRR